MDFRALNELERADLINALRGNANGEGGIALDPRDTSFRGVAGEVTDDEVISVIKAIPCHYAG